MYSRMDLSTSNERCDAKSKKKYELSLKRGNHTVHQKSNYISHKSEKEATLKTLKNCNETADSSESQNFMLRLSDSFLAADTQDDNSKINVAAKNVQQNEVIVISDSSEDELSTKYEWMNLKTSELTRDTEKRSISSRNFVYTIQSSDSEDGNVEKRWDSSRTDNPMKYLSAKQATRKCSIMYTSDETVSDTGSANVSKNKENFFKSPINTNPATNVIPDSDDSIFSFDRMRGILTVSDTGSANIPKNKENFLKSPVNADPATNVIPDSDDSIFTFNRMRGILTVSDTGSANISKNKENFLKSPINADPATSVIPDSDDSIFSFDRMRGLLTENGRNIDASKSADRLKESNKRNEDFRITPIHDKISTDKTGSARSLKEINRRIEEWRRTPELTKITKVNTGSLKNLKETNRRIDESQSSPEFDQITRNQTGSLKKLKETNRRIDKSPSSLEFEKITKNHTGSLKNLKETNRRIDESPSSPEFEKITKNHTGSLKNLKETNRRIRESKNQTGSLNNLREFSKRREESHGTPEFPKISKKETGSLKNLKQTNGKIEESRQTPNFSRIPNKVIGSLKNLHETARKIDEPQRTPISTKVSSPTTILSNKDVRSILKVIRSKRAIFESPREYKKPQNSDDSDIEESDDDSILSPKSNVETRNNDKTTNPIVIAETDSGSEDHEIIHGSQVDLSKPYKTHVTRFLDPAVNYYSPNGMSEKKRLEIAHWLMTNSTDTRSESSISNVSASNSPHSGNSSLERLEINYETPNNRDKMRMKVITNERSNNCPIDSAKSTKSTKLRQTTIDNYVKKRVDGEGTIFTPVAPATKKKESSVTKEVTENLEIKACADILDNLYGNAWRSKANDILPLTEPRKKNILLRDKGVQTERKVYPRSKRVTKSSDSGSQEDGFDTFVKNIKPNLNSTKKPVTESDRRRQKFIKDSSSSPDSCGENTFLTALTNPRNSNNVKITNQPTPLSLKIQRGIAICDSDTEDENDKRTETKKVLSFSDDESDTSTSEYDPNDVIPPKNTTKSRGALATSKNVTKIPKIPIPVSNAKMTKTKSSFLASLSSTIPIIEAHPDAKKYRQDYKNTKEELSKYLYKLYNENIFDKKLPSDMSIEWNVRMRGTAGFCYNKRSVKALGGVTRSSRIVLATKILDTPDRLRDTLVHEMCHAAAWLINNVSDGHGPFWKGWASKAMKTFPELPAIKRCHDYKITTKFTYRCTGCGYSVGRHSKSLDVEKKRCGHCYGKFELLVNKVTKSGTIETKTPVAKKPTGFALFVKEHYSTVKKGRKGVPHKEVMQILGQQFSTIKISKKNENSDENNPANESND